MNKYILVGWPEIQNFMDSEHWGECFLCLDVGGQQCDDSIYAVPENVYKEVIG